MDLMVGQFRPLLEQNRPVVVPKMKDLLPIGARKDMLRYKPVMDKFVPCVVGVTMFKKRMRRIPEKEENLWIISDEAFLYLVIENGYDR